MTQFLDNGISDDLGEVRTAVREGRMTRRASRRAVPRVLAVLCVPLALCGGCANTPTGVRVVASSATATNLGDIAWDEYKIPVFSVYTGPKTTIWINRDYIALKSVTAGGCVTNDTSALGVYQSREQKQTRVTLEFAPVAATNAPCAACPMAGAQASADVTETATAKYGQAQ